MTTATEYAHAHFDDFQQQLMAWLRIPSISTDPTYRDEVRRAAGWLADDMRRMGLENVAILETGGHPVVYGDWLHAGDDKPTVLVYGHYDVQPAEDVDLWQSPPFEPQVRDGKLYARGATDNKGQAMIQMKAMEALLATDGCPVNVKYVIEGEEESASVNLQSFVSQHKDLLAADVCLISDTVIESEHQPSILYSLRGLVAMELVITGPQQDLHSGLGGMLHNPAQALAEIIASLHDAEGRVTVPGFYDAVRPLGDDERDLLKSADIAPERWQRMMGDLPAYGERGYTKAERMGARPTLEINGISGGYAGDGFKTVIPAQARAKISCRLVADQNAEDIYRRVHDHLLSLVPPTVRARISAHGLGQPAMTPIDHPAIQAARRAYRQVWGVEPVYTRGGGSIPIVADFQQMLGVPVVLMGFGLPDANAHGPNENFYLSVYRRGIDAVMAFLHEIGG